jgi:hypothetical protein
LHQTKPKRTNPLGKPAGAVVIPQCAILVLFWCYFSVKVWKKREEMDGVNKDFGDLNIIL